LHRPEGGSSRRHPELESVLGAGWLVALPVPFLPMWAPTWGWVIFADLLLA
jgi:hypothetical protein